MAGRLGGRTLLELATTACEEATFDAGAVTTTTELLLVLLLLLMVVVVVVVVIVDKATLEIIISGVVWIIIGGAFKGGGGAGVITFTELTLRLLVDVRVDVVFDDVLLPHALLLVLVTFESANVLMALLTIGKGMLTGKVLMVGGD